MNTGAPHIEDRDETIDRVCRGVASLQEGKRLRQYIAALEAQNTALSNLADNLAPGPISEALANTLHAQSLEQPSAWMAEDGRLIRHETKMTLTPRSAVAAFVKPLYQSRDGGRVLRYAVKQLLIALPPDNEWLDPDIESILRNEIGISK